MRSCSSGVNGIKVQSVFCTEPLIDGDPQRRVCTGEGRIDDLKPLRVARGKRSAREELKNDQEHRGAEFSYHACSFENDGTVNKKPSRSNRLIGGHPNPAWNAA